MFESLQRIFSGALAPAADAEDEAARLRLATCILLLEAAHADAEFSAAEHEVVNRIVRERFDLDPARADELLAAAEAARRDSGDLYRFARQLNDSFTEPRKLAVIELLWEVVYGDGVLEAHEDALMHKLGTVLGVRHDALMALKLKVKNRLG